MNKVAVKLLKYVKERNPYKDAEYHRDRSRQIWDKYGERPIKRAMNHSACTSILELEKLAKYYFEKEHKE